MKALRSFVLLICVVTLNVYTYGQTNLLINDIYQTFTANMASMPQEKSYLHLDKPYYLTGDTIWLKGYLVDAVTHKEEAMSRFLYVELINRKNQLCQRKKKRKDENEVFRGYIALDEKMEEGEYYLRAYTNYMCNAGDEYFFTHNISIYSSQVPLCITTIRYLTDERNRQWGIVCFRRPNGTPFIGEKVTYMVRAKEKKNPICEGKTNAQGELKIELPTVTNRLLSVDITLYEADLKHKKTFYVPASYDYHVGFYPEGGDLIEGVMQKIAFKTESPNGISIPVEGIVVDERNDTITSFRTDYNGIGSFMLKSQEGKRYKAITTNLQQQEKIFNLPAPQKNKVALALRAGNNGLLYYQILTSSDTPEQSYILMAHIRGKIELLQELPVGNKQGTLQIQSLPGGIAHFVLLDKQRIPLSERLLFIPQIDPKWQITQDKDRYARRSLVRLNLRLTDTDGNPLQGDFSISITDNYAVNQDSLSGDIRSALLLTSDLKGNVETPGYYFGSPNRQRQIRLDNLMLTHGWSRFQVNDLLQKDFTPKLDHYLEIGQALSGMVRTGTGKPLANATVGVSIPAMRYFRFCQTDKQGRFLVDKLAFFDGTSVMASVNKKNKLLYPTIELDPDLFPKPVNYHPYHVPVVQASKEFMDSVQSGFIIEDGVRVYRLPDVEINAKRTAIASFISRTMDEDELEQKDARSALDLLLQYPGVYYVEGRAYLYSPYRPVRAVAVHPDKPFSPGGKMQGNTRSVVDPRIPFARIYLDGRLIARPESLAQIKADQISSISKMEPEVEDALGIDPASDEELEDMRRELGISGEEETEMTDEEMDGYAVTSVSERQNAKVVNATLGQSSMLNNIGSYGGRIMFTSKTGNIPLPRESSLIATQTPLGCARYQEFYQPHYETEAQKSSLQPDNRVTIHWQPNLKLDSQGQTNISFYTGDRVTPYTVIIEGITIQGIPCRYNYLLKK